MGGDGTVPVDQGGDTVTVPWCQDKILCPNKPGNGDVSHPPGMGVPFNLAFAWQGKRGWGPIFHLGHLDIAW